MIFQPSPFSARYPYESPPIRGPLKAHGGGFTPLDLGATLKLWTPGNDYNDVTGIWSDQSGNGNSPIAISKPSAIPSGLDGNQTIGYNGTSNYFSVSDFINLGNTESTLFCVLKGGVFGNGVIEQHSLGGSNRWVMWKGSLGNFRFFFNALDSGISGDSNFVIRALQWDGSNASHWVNGGTGDVFPASSFDAIGGGFRIGNAGASFTEFFDGEMADLIICNSALSTFDLNRVGNYYSSIYPSIAWTNI